MKKVKTKTFFRKNNVDTYFFETTHAMPKLVCGFTLVETMVAITILTIALTGPFLAVQTSLTAAYVARDELIASSLAQEGLEYVRSIRDNNYLNNRSWTDGFSDTTQNRNLCFGSNPGSNVCVVDPTQDDFHNTPTSMRGYASAAAAPALFLSTGNLYNEQSLGTQTQFKRTVQLTSVSADEIKVTITVSWTTRGTMYSTTVVDTLRDWEPGFSS